MKEERKIPADKDLQRLSFGMVKRKLWNFIWDLLEYSYKYMDYFMLAFIISLVLIPALICNGLLYFFIALIR